MEHILTKAVEEAPPPAYLVGIRREGMTLAQTEEHLDELEALTETFGAPVVGREVATLRLPTASHLLNPGKVADIKTCATAVEAQVIVVDDDLTPSQQRNWEKLTGLAVIDRCEVILGIFADRARTREARLQVDLARAEYSLPRLTRQWSHLERQRGGGGFRGGAGELQLEVDRRLVRTQIERLKRELKHVRQVRSTQRERRLLVPVPGAALVGYTNAGKSTLLNALTGAGVLVEDKLFATLDPTTRRFSLPDRQDVVLTDTVGFIRKLPTMLVDAFKSTLEEAQLSNMLIHVVDASHPGALEQRKATEAILRDLEIADKPTILVLNKADKVEDEAVLPLLAEGYENVAITSAIDGRGTAHLASLMSKLCGDMVVSRRVCIPPNRHDLIALLSRTARVDHEEYDDSANYCAEVGMARRLEYKFSDYIVSGEEKGGDETNA